MGTWLLASGCNVFSSSDLSVAGGKDDKDTYAGTFYVEFNGRDRSTNTNRIIRNVGTIVDTSSLAEGLKGSYVLILSLADVFKADGSEASLPFFDGADLTLFQGPGKTPIEFKGLSLEEGFLVEKGSQPQGPKLKYKVLQVGVKVVGSGGADADKTKDKVAAYHLLESKLDVNGLNLRNQFTSFLLISIPKIHRSLQGLKIPKLVPAEDRTSDVNPVLVGYGETEVGTKEKGFHLTEPPPGLRVRNFKEVSLLGDTPLQKKIKILPEASQQLWEIKGSGLCRTSTTSPLPGQTLSPNYDTGAAVYSPQNEEQVFLGFGVRTTAISAKYQDYLRNCKETTMEDMATLIVSVSKNHIRQLKTLVEP